MDYVHCFSLCGYMSVRTWKTIFNFSFHLPSSSSCPIPYFLWIEGRVCAWPVGPRSTPGPGWLRRSDYAQDSSAGLSCSCVPHGIWGAGNPKTKLLQGHSVVMFENEFKCFGTIVVNCCLYPWFSNSLLEVAGPVSRFAGSAGLGRNLFQEAHFGNHCFLSTGISLQL